MWRRRMGRIRVRMMMMVVVVIPVAMVVVLAVGVGAHRDTLYSACHTGKGSIRLYNCGQNAHNLAHMQLDSAPTR